MGSRRTKTGFTIIELLVVVAVIALLISILLPALSRAREQGRAVVCLSNLKQTTQAFFLYAEDFGVIPGTYWQGPLNLDWAGRVNEAYLRNPGRYRHPIETSVLRTYISHMDRILECPTAQREANTFFDYTVIIRFAGARTDLPWRMTYPEDPTRRTETRRYFQALPLLIEEDRFWYNESYDDGSWANRDQITDRHGGKSNMAYLDGSVSRFKASKGGNPELEEPQDLTARHLLLWTGRRPHLVWRSNDQEFGWVNRLSPR